MWLPGPARPRLVALSGLAAMASAVGIGRFIYTPILPQMVAQLGIGEGDAGLIAAANFLGYLGGALLAAWPRLPGGPRAWLFGGLIANAVLLAAMAASDSLPVFLALRLLGGFASAFVLVCASTMVLQHLALAGREDLSAWHFAGVGVGIALSALIAIGVDAGWNGGWMGGWTGDLAPWRALWMAGALASLLGLFGMPWLSDPPGTADTVGAPAAAGNADSAARPALWPLVLAYGLFGFGYIVTATFIVAIVRGAPEIADLEAWIWLGVGLAAVPSVAIWLAVARRWGVLAAYAAACLIEAAGVIASVFWISTAGLAIAAVALGGTFMGLTALGLVAARTLRPDRAQRSLGLMTAAFGLGQIAGPVVAGYGHDWTGSFAVGSLLAALGLIVAAALILAMRRALPAGTTV